MLSAGAALALLAGCSSGGSSGTALPASQGPGTQSIARGAVQHFMKIDALHGKLGTPSDNLRFSPDPFDPAAPKHGVYGSQYGSATTNLGGLFNLYAVPDTKNAKPVCTNDTVTEINGIDVDSTGTLWVPGVLPPKLTKNVVYTYDKETCTRGKTTYTETNGEPSDIAFATTGTNYVLDIVDTALTNGVISIYPKGKTKPTATLQLPGELVGTGSSQGLALGIGTDIKNNVYATYLASGGGTDLAVFKGGKGKGTILQDSTSARWIGITFDSKGNLLAADSLGLAIDVFAPPYTGTPTTLPTESSTVPVDLKLDATNTNLYVADATNGTIDVYKYPSGTYEYSISTGLSQSDNVEGVAVDPSDNN
jgi:hypothetical protein